MSSSNEVRVVILEEKAEYNKVEPTGNFLSMRFASETLDGTPNAAQSPEIRNDRVSAGMVVLDTVVSGGINGLFLRDPSNDLLIGCGMYNDVVPKVPMAATTIAVNASTKVITFTVGDPSAVFTVGDVSQLSGFVAPALSNNTTIVVVAVDATSITYAGGELMVTTVGAGAEIATLPAVLTIGKVKRSVSIEKSYTDLTDAHVDYTGERVEGLQFNMSFADFSTINFTFAGSGHIPMPDAGDEMTDSRTITPATTNEILNSAQDLETILVDGAAIACGFSSLQVSMVNNHSPQNLIGNLTACDQSAGQATISIAITAELGDTNSDWLKGKLELTPMSIYASMADANGQGYALRLPAVQVTAPDPNAGGQNQQTTLDLTGEAKVGVNGESPLYVYLLE